MAGASLRSIKGKVVPIRICLSPELPEEARTEDDYFEVGYRQYAYSIMDDAKAKKFRDNGQQIENLVSQLPAVLAWWTLKEGPTEEQQSALVAAQNDLMEAGTNDIERKSARDRLKVIEEEIRRTVAAQSPIPLTFEALQDFPVTLAQLIFQQIGESRNPNPSGTEPLSQVG